MSAELTLIQKFNEAKKRLADADLKKSGKNTFSKYEYFELGDFLPTIINAEHELNFLNHVTFPVIDGVESAQLTVYDGSSDKSLSFTSKTAEVEMKGMAPIQGIGAKQTYMRRYLYVLAYEISEHDAVDEDGVKDKQDIKTDAGKNSKVSNTPPPKTEAKPAEDKTHYLKIIQKAIYPDATKESLGSPDGFCYEIYQKAMQAYMSMDKTVKKLQDLSIDKLKDMAQQMEVPPVLR